jgi:NADH:ubiquinone oxidoreductase subunit E
MELKVCVGSSCHLRGSEMVVQTFQRIVEKENLASRVELKGSFCMGECSEVDVSVHFNGQSYRTTPDEAESLFYSQLLPLIRG